MEKLKASANRSLFDKYALVSLSTAPMRITSFNAILALFRCAFNSDSKKPAFNENRKRDASQS